jgi:hypothetical protein
MALVKHIDDPTRKKVVKEVKKEVPVSPAKTDGKGKGGK